MLEPSSEAEVEAFEAWLDADPAHGRTYAESEALAALSTRLPRRLLAGKSQSRPVSILRPAFAAAAAVVLLVGSAFVMTGPGRQSASAAIVNPGPAVRTYRLVDGTMIMVDSGARLDIALEPDERSVKLQSGRVRFTILRDGDRPFWISAASAKFRTSAATVDVSLRGAEVQIIVLDGEVALIEPSRPDDSPDEQLKEGSALAIVGRSQRDLVVTPADRRWPEARLAFENAPLAAIVERANQRGRPRIEVDDPAIGRIHVSGVLDIRDTRSLARKLAATLDLEIEERSDRIKLVRPAAR